MVMGQHLNPGMTIGVKKKIYRVESAVKVKTPKGSPFVKVKLLDLDTHKTSEKNFKLNESLDEVTLDQQELEFLYLEGKEYLFLDVKEFEQVLVPQKVVGDKANYLKEGVPVTASFHGDVVFAVDLPQFLEVMVAKVEAPKGKRKTGGESLAELETGATVEVPSFIEPGDIIKVDTRLNEFIQRV